MTPTMQNSPWKHRGAILVPLLSLASLAGCQGAPSISIVGSFFPDWIFCCLIGIFAAVVAYRLFVGLKMEGEVQPAVLIYPCIALSSAVTLWLLIFG